MSQAKPSRLGRLARLLLLGAAAAGAMLAYQIWTYRSVTADGSADAALVMGAAVWGDHPSPVFEQRILHAIDLYQRGRVGRLLLTGGSGDGKQPAEAEVARRYAVARGVRPAHIAVEVASHSSYENLAGAKRIAAEQGIRTVLIVSDPLHMKRAMSMADSLGLDARPSPTPTSRYDEQWDQAVMLARETYFLAAFFVEQYTTRLLGHDGGQAAASKAALRAR